MTRSGPMLAPVTRTPPRPGHGGEHPTPPTCTPPPARSPAPATATGPSATASTSRPAPSTRTPTTPGSITSGPPPDAPTRSASADTSTASTPPPARSLSTLPTSALPDGMIYKALRQPPHLRLPVLCRNLPARRLPAHPRRADRRQRHPRTRRHPPGRVRHLHRPLLRPRPHPARPAAHLHRQDRLPLQAAALPRPPRPRDLPARPRRWPASPATAATIPPWGSRCARTATTTTPTSCGTTTPANCGGAPNKPSNATSTSSPAAAACPTASRVSHGKAAEYQARGAVHFHVLLRLDGLDDARPRPAPAPAPRHHRRRPRRRHPARRRHHHLSDPAAPGQPGGLAGSPGATNWTSGVITMRGTGTVTDLMVATYLAKYSTKGTEVTGHTSNRLTPATIEPARRRRPALTRNGSSTPAGNSAPIPTTELAAVGAHARLRRPLPHQRPPLLDHLRRPARRPHHLPPHPGPRPRTRAHPHRRPRATRKPPSSSATSPTPEPAGKPPATPSSPAPPPTKPENDAKPETTNSPTNITRTPAVWLHNSPAAD